MQKFLGYLGMVLALLQVSVETQAETLKELKVTSPVPGGSNFSLIVLEEIVKRQGQYRLVFPQKDMGRVSLDKTFSDFEAGELDLLWTLSNREYEARWQAVHYPLYLGMFGLRIPIIKQEETQKFAGVRNLRDMQQFTAGQGKNWADTNILIANGIPTVPVTKYESHFPMLEGGRFDYFPRAIHEPWDEIARNEAYRLTVDEYVLLRYRVPFYFFVSKDNKALHDYLVAGMEELTVSGRHKELFFEQAEVRQALTASGLEKRVVIDLENPDLTPETPIDRPELWFDPFTDSTPY